MARSSVRPDSEIPPLRADLVLSSGFLAFAEHAGFLAAVEAAEIEVTGVCGTSSGALAGVGVAAGLGRDELLARLFARPPIAFLRPSWTPWRGLASLSGVVELLREVLPPRFEDLPLPFGVGVVNEAGRAELVTSGPLPEAVAASMAIPRVFLPVRVGERLLADGGVVDRTGLAAWRARRGKPVILHLLESTGSRFGGTATDGDPGDGDPDVTVVRSPRSKASFFSLGDVQNRFEATRDRALAALPMR